MKKIGKFGRYWVYFVTGAVASDQLTAAFIAKWGPRMARVEFSKLKTIGAISDDVAAEIIRLAAFRALGLPEVAKESK